MFVELFIPVDSMVPFKVDTLLLMSLLFKLKHLSLSILQDYLIISIIIFI